MKPVAKSYDPFTRVVRHFKVTVQLKESALKIEIVDQVSIEEYELELSEDSIREISLIREIIKTPAELFNLLRCSDFSVTDNGILVVKIQILNYCPLDGKTLPELNLVTNKKTFTEEQRAERKYEKMSKCLLDHQYQILKLQNGNIEQESKIKCLEKKVEQQKGKLAKSEENIKLLFILLAFLGFLYLLGSFIYILVSCGKQTKQTHESNANTSFYLDHLSKDFRHFQLDNGQLVKNRHNYAWSYAVGLPLKPASISQFMFRQTSEHIIFYGIATAETVKLANDSFLNSNQFVGYFSRGVFLSNSTQTKTQHKIRSNDEISFEVDTIIYQIHWFLNGKKIMSVDIPQQMKRKSIQPLIAMYEKSSSVKIM